MPEEKDFDPGLWKLLQRTWINIASIHSYSEIYAWYNEADYAVAESYNPNEMNYFLRGLQELGKRAANYAEIRVQEPGWPTLADALAGGLGGENIYTFEMIRAYVDDTILVSEEEIAAAMAFALEEHHLVVEGGGAVGIAAVLSEKVRELGKNVAVVLSGSNVDIPILLEAVQNHHS